MNKTALKARPGPALVGNRQPSPPRPGRESRINAAAKNLSCAYQAEAPVKAHPVNAQDRRLDTEQCTLLRFFCHLLPRKTPTGCGHRINHPQFWEPKLHRFLRFSRVVPLITNDLQRFGNHHLQARARAAGQSRSNPRFCGLNARYGDAT